MTEKDPGRVVEARYVASATASDQLPPPVGVEIAFAGRSNVGKSSLLNAVLGRRGLARTSRTPGCTRQISFFEARTADGAVITLVDLPGYGYARRSKSERLEWAGMIEEYLLERPTLRAVMLLVDVRRGPEGEERQVLDLVASPPRVSRLPLEVLVAATKLDKLSASARKPAVAKITQQLGRPAYGMSTEDPALAQALWRRVRSAVGLPITTAERAG